uniref:BACK domain-containing protein n=1 Tax=Glossina palpalis gambiensis TaxID=67801 RepID=A0A1B0B9U9_9MUSC
MMKFLQMCSTYHYLLSFRNTLLHGAYPMKDDVLAAQFEDNVYKAVLNWVKFDLHNRKAHFAHLKRHLLNLILREEQQSIEFLIEGLSYQSAPADERKYLSARVTADNAFSCNVYDISGKKLNDCHGFKKVEHCLGFVLTMIFTHQLSMTSHINYESCNHETNKWRSCAHLSTESKYFNTRTALRGNSTNALAHTCDFFNRCFRFDPREGHYYTLKDLRETSSGHELVSYRFISQGNAASASMHDRTRISMWSERYGFSEVTVTDNIYTLGHGVLLNE